MRIQTIALSLAFAALVAGASVSAAGTPRTTAVAAPAVHTATTEHRRHTHAPRHHAHRHHTRVAQLSARHVDHSPQHPATPHRAERRAALPHQLRTHREQTGSRTGARHLAATVAGGGLLAVAVQRLETSQNFDRTACSDGVTLGRGPPRAGPLSNSPHFLSVGPRRSLRSAARTLPGSASLFHRSPARSLLLPAAARREFRRPRDRSLVQPEQLHGRSHADRPEGAMVCLIMPSTGDSP